MNRCSGTRDTTYKVHTKVPHAPSSQVHNIFLTSRNLVKVGDFGISKVLDATVAMAKSTVGTPYYLPPEVISNKPYGRKADVWALGVIVYELVTLRKPFDAENLVLLAIKIVNSDPPPIPDSFSPALKELITSMLQATQSSHQDTITTQCSALMNSPSS